MRTLLVPISLLDLGINLLVTKLNDLPAFIILSLDVVRLHVDPPVELSRQKNMRFVKRNTKSKVTRITFVARHRSLSIQTIALIPIEGLGSSTSFSGI